MASRVGVAGPRTTLDPFVGVAGQVGGVAQAQFMLDVLAMAFDCLEAQSQFAGDFPRAPTLTSGLAPVSGPREEARISAAPMDSARAGEASQLRVFKDIYALRCFGADAD